MSNTKNFTWLHITDLHAGVVEQDWMWPTLKHLFYEDIKKLHEKVGNIDCVVFSGDLTQKGTKDDFNILTGILKELWEEFRILGLDPKLFLVPGNHDLERPKSDAAEVIALTDSWGNPKVQNAFWTDGSQYKRTVDSIFSNFINWKESLKEFDIPLLETKVGLIPGDCSAVYSINELNIGLIGLNSAWLQLNGESCSGKLHVDSKQLLALTNNDPTAWCRENDINLLITHHPTSWLSQSNIEHFNNEIYRPERFDTHVYGHMHEHSSTLISVAGNDERRYFQGASLFGLKYFDDRKASRVSGYSISRIQIENNKKSMVFWPRSVRELSDGTRVLGADTKLKLNEDNSITYSLGENKASKSVLKDTKPLQVPAITLASLSTYENVLERVKYHLSTAKEHVDVRKVEQANCLVGIKEKRSIWLISEWGMDADSFLWVIKNRLDETKTDTYKIDLQDYKSRDDFLDSIRENLNCSFGQFCELLSVTGTAYLILEDIPNGPSSSTNFSLVENDIEEMVDTILQYCPSIKIIMRSRKAPTSHHFSAIELKPFDEPDTKTYIAVHKLGGISYTKQAAVERIFRHTDGVPSRIDSTLKELQVIPLSELATLNKDISEINASPIPVSNALIQAVHSLSKSVDPMLLRAFELLKVLTIFPQGEQLARIKRFNGPNAFYPNDARELIERALVQASIINSVGELASSGEPLRLLTVARPIREYVHTLLKKDELNALNQKALSLYFGPKALSGEYKTPSDLRFDHPKRLNSEIANASILIQRIIKAATAGVPNARKIKQTLSLATYFCNALIKGNHYRSGVAFASDFLSLCPESGYQAEVAQLRYYFARCLRMIGDSEYAIKHFIDIKDSIFDKVTKQSIYLQLALCYEKKGEFDDAIKYAEESKKLDKKSFNALQADSIIIDNKTADPDRVRKLRALEQVCRKRGANTVANNIGLDLVNEVEDEAQVREQLTALRANSIAAKDTYNAIRATVKLGKMSSEGKYELTSKEQSDLIDAYHFLYNERLDALFNDCNEALWGLFQRLNDEANLFRLYRHSSLIWRLRTEQNYEEKFVEKLLLILSNRMINVKEIRREASYFMARLQSLKNPRIGEIAFSEPLN